MPDALAFPSAVRPLLDMAYWRVRIRPAEYNSQRVSFSNLESLLQGIQVRLRGWYFPHLATQADKIERGSNYYGVWSDFADYEYWRFYESAQLIYYRSAREERPDYKQKLRDESHRNLAWSAPDFGSVNGYLDIINVLYTVTEIFEFAGRLSRKLGLSGKMQVEIELHNIGGFILAVSDPARAWDHFYQWPKPSISKLWEIDASELMIEADRYGLDAVIWLFQHFGWTDVNAQALQDAQAGFLRKRE